MKKLIYLVILLSQLLLGVAWAEAFVVRNIEIQGLQRISAETVESYLPLRRGEVLRPGKTAQVLKALYQTAFFERIHILRQNNTLIIRVVERPTIGQLKIAGNSIVPTDKLTTVMKSLDIAEGHVYNPAMLDKIKQSLLNQYYQLGRYNARVDVNVTPMSRNRVLVQINISEGLVAKIRGISMIGNHAFSEDVLIKQLSGSMTTPGLFTFFTQTDRYSEEKLEESLNTLRNYYLDHGYVRFMVKSAQAQVTPDRKSVYVTIVIEEGQPYIVKGYELRGQLVLPREELLKQIHVRPGEVFSRQKIIDAEKNITSLFGDQGYIFSSVSLRPHVDDSAKTIFIIFDINAAKRAYVRHVSFSDNTRTNDMVLRREVEQLEGAPVSTAKLEQSKLRLNRLPYIRNVDMSVNRVPAADDQVDVDYRVKEDSSAQASFKIGYSQLYHALIGIGLNHKNFLGTGKTLGINFTRSKFEQFYGIDYTDPYYTADGISRSFNFSIARTDPGNISISNGFTTNEYNLGVLYGIPVGQEQGIFNQFQLGVGYQNTLVKLLYNKDGTPQFSNQVADFVARNGRHFQEAVIKLGFSRDSRDKAIFPTKGVLQTLFFNAYMPLDSRSLSFYALDYHGKWYYPLTDSFIATARADLGYGNGMTGVQDYPFYRNYYAGGIDSVRGYEGYSLGPRDSNDNPFGGNVLIDSSIGLIFPNYISDNLRTTLFMDVGNVYSTWSSVVALGGSGSGPLRYSVGVQADWLIPSLGPITLSLAKPLNRQPGSAAHRSDFIQSFDFAIGANF